MPQLIVALVLIALAGYVLFMILIGIWTAMLWVWSGIVYLSSLCGLLLSNTVYFGDRLTFGVLDWAGLSGAARGTVGWMLIGAIVGSGVGLHWWCVKVQRSRRVPFVYATCAALITLLALLGPAPRAVHAATPREPEPLVVPAAVARAPSAPAAPTVDQRPQRAAALIAEGDALAKKFVNIGSARAKYHAALSEDPSSAYAQYRVAYTSYRLGEFDAALSAASQAEGLARRADRKDILSDIEGVRGCVAELRSNWAEARRLYATALALKADSDWVQQAQQTMELYLDPPSALLHQARRIIDGETLTSDDIANLSHSELRVLRNAAYARHGVDLHDAGVNRFYYEEHSSWSLGRSVALDPGAKRSALDANDKRNIRLIVKRQKALQRGGSEGSE